MDTDHSWVVDRHDGFAFKGPSGNSALTDLAIVSRDGSLPVVVATERDDNPGISVTNGAEQLAAEVLLRVFPERIGQEQPFRLVEHYRDGAIESSMKEVTFANFDLDRNGNAPRIGDVSVWKTLDARVAAVLDEQTKAPVAEMNQGADLSLDDEIDFTEKHEYPMAPEQGPRIPPPGTSLGDTPEANRVRDNYYGHLEQDRKAQGEAAIQGAWPQIVGEQYARASHPTGVAGETLLVHTAFDASTALDAYALANRLGEQATGIIASVSAIDPAISELQFTAADNLRFNRDGNKVQASTVQQREQYVAAAIVRPDTEIARYFDFAGKPVTQQQWNDLGEAVFRREVHPFDKFTRVSETMEIETGWRGRDWKESGPPDNWRTIVYEDGQHPRLTAFYVTEKEAKAGHRQTIAIETGKAPAPAVEAVQSRDPEIRYGKSGQPYIPDLVGVYHLDEPRIEQRMVLDEKTGETYSHSYGVAAGDHSIIGALTPERDRVLDAAVAFRGVDLETHKAEYLTEQLGPERFLELSKANRISLEPGIIELAEAQDLRIEQEHAQEMQPTLGLSL